MTYLKCSEMPLSFTSQALYIAASSNLINPPNVDQSLVNRIIGKPLRTLTRLILQVAISILIPFGIAYHSSMAIYYSLRAIHTKQSKQKLLAWEHFKASLNDLIYIGNIVGGAVSTFCTNPNDAVSFYMSSSLVKVEHIRVPLDNDVNRNKINIISADSMNTLFHFNDFVRYSLHIRDQEGQVCALDELKVKIFDIPKIKKKIKKSN